MIGEKQPVHYRGGASDAVKQTGKRWAINGQKQPAPNRGHAADVGKQTGQRSATIGKRQLMTVPRPADAAVKQRER